MSSCWQHVLNSRAAMFDNLLFKIAFSRALIFILRVDHVELKTCEHGVIDLYIVEFGFLKIRHNF